MKYFNFKLLLLALLFSTGIQITSCKSKSKDTTDTTTNTGTTVDSSTTSAAPVTISGDDELKKGLSDATKDYPGVTATTNDGEVTLTGDIKRDQLPKLIMAVNALHPKKVNNKLTIK